MGSSIENGCSRAVRRLLPLSRCLEPHSQRYRCKDKDRLDRHYRDRTDGTVLVDWIPRVMHEEVPFTIYCYTELQWVEIQLSFGNNAFEVLVRPPMEDVRPVVSGFVFRMQKRVWRGRYKFGGYQILTPN